MDISIDDVIKFSITPKMDVDKSKNGSIWQKKIEKIYYWDQGGGPDVRCIVRDQGVVGRDQGGAGTKGWLAGTKGWLAGTKGWLG